MPLMTRCLSLVLLLLASASASAAPLSGIGRSIDGDSLMVGQQEVRLFGIDALEFTQTCTREGQPWACGSAAADQLSKLMSGKQVTCVSVGVDKHRRVLARCSVGATDLNRTMVATGYALAYRRYSKDYISAEDSAKAAKRGIWSGTFQLPSDVRHADDDHHIPTASPKQHERINGPPVTDTLAKPTGNCRIKGNRSRSGDWIYHVPGMPDYAQTVAEEVFCSEAQARAAGYRRSRADRRR